MSIDSASILIVDDSDLVQATLCRILSGQYECKTAVSAEHALELMAEYDFDLVLTDIIMPGMSGLELCGFIRNRWPTLPVILISGMMDIQCAISAMKQGAFDYITKPFHPSHVSLAVERALRCNELLVCKRKHEESLEEAVRLRSNQLHGVTKQINAALESLYTNYRATLRALCASLEARHVEARGHADRVVAYSLRLANQLGLGQHEIIALEQGALLHDIGKIAVPDAILSKAGPLTTLQW